MNKRLLLYILLITSINSNAQIFKKYADGLHVNAFFHQQGINYYLGSVDQNGLAYYIQYDTVSSGFKYGEEFTQVRLQIYNGISWLCSPSVKIYSLHSIDAPRILDIQSIDGNVYITGSFDSSENNLGAGVLKFNGQNWETIGADLLQSFPDYFEVKQILGFNKQLFITGNFDSIPGLRVNGLLWYDGFTWKAVGNSPPYGFGGVSGTDNVYFSTVNDSLYAYNKNKIKPDSMVIGGDVYRRLAVFENGVFKQIYYPFEYLSNITTYNNQLVVIPTFQFNLHIINFSQVIWAMDIF
ncbi:MAG: hypothetical protein R2852_08960 [Bacteroidia bacterium]